ncbi:unnamed protein product [Orchesella dallaii]|uniref:Syntaxin 6/10/61 N-terminal domain-containing protein n=1 Tax=Orchesella dallaii TaxID=48710 RepID=A0ABP1QJ00_9HEXA
MSLDDPFIVVKDEVCKALGRTRELFQHWSENCQGSNEVSEWVASQLRNGLRSLEWDLDDLEATLAIAKRQGLRDNKEISSRLNFIIKTRQEIQNIKDELNLKREDWDTSARQPESPRCGNKKAKYSKLENESPEKVVVVSSPNTLCVECDENALMLEDFGQEVDLIGGEDGSSQSFFWTRFKYVPMGKRVWILLMVLVIAFICSLTSLVLVFVYGK